MSSIIGITECNGIRGLENLYVAAVIGRIGLCLVNEFDNLESSIEYINLQSSDLTNRAVVDSVGSVEGQRRSLVGHRK